MAAGAIIGAIVGAVGGGLVNGITAVRQQKKLAKAYQKAATQIRDATEKYSGKNLYEGMKRAGEETAYQYGRNAERVNSETFGPGQTDNAMAKANDLVNQSSANTNAAAQQGMQAGMATDKSIKDTKYNADTIAAQQMLKQANIDYNAANQGMQTIMNTAGGLASMTNNLVGGMKKGKDN